jgi:demethylmenaquinone methyltransferase / 2-methoxy-6-polyprenyl-1,4-benzoquinol methylase
MSGPSVPFGFADVDPDEKPRLVRGVFDRVAPRYDLMNDLMSGGLHRVWKDMAAARLNPQPGELIVDCAGGTGDMARRIAGRARSVQRRRGGRDATVAVVDFDAAMVAQGLARGSAPEILWAVGDAQRLPLPSACVDAYVIAFGLRNVTDIPRALAEARRVLKPGGRYFCLEFSRPPSSAVRAAYDAWSFRAIPRIGEVVAKDRPAYDYLVESIRRHPDQARLAEMMGRAGFKRVEWTNYTGGVVALHTGWAL